MKPEISVIMPVYNEEKHLDESIISILFQSFKDFELIIVNDCSTDNSLNIIKHYVKKDNRVKLINLKKNKGCTDARNSGLKVAKGKYIAILDGDDTAFPDRLSIQFNYLENNPHIFLVGGSAIYTDEYGLEIRRFRKYDDYEMLAWRLPKSCGIVHSSIMFRNESLSYEPYYDSASEYKFYLDLLSKGKNLTNIPEFLVSYRTHKGSISVYDCSKQDRLTKEIQEGNKFRGKFRLRFLPKLFLHYIKTYKEKK